MYYVYFNINIKYIMVKIVELINKDRVKLIFNFIFRF